MVGHHLQKPSINALCDSALIQRQSFQLSLLGPNQVKQIGKSLLLKVAMVQVQVPDVGALDHML